MQTCNCHAKTETGVKTDCPLRRRCRQQVRLSYFNGQFVHQEDPPWIRSESEFGPIVLEHAFGSVAMALWHDCCLFTDVTTGGVQWHSRSRGYEIMSAPENCPGNGNQSTDFLDFTVREVSFEKGKSRKITRPVPIEAPVAFEICGFGYAVMMATPTDLEDFALGFLLSERLVSRKD